MSDERRENLRVDINISCHFGTFDKLYPATTSNLSHGGVLLTLEEDVSASAKVGDVAECEIRLVSKTYYIPGEVRRVDGCEVALSFRALNAEKIADLTAALNAVRTLTEE